MTVIDFNPEDLGKFLKDVEEANAQIQNAVEKLAKAVKEVEPKWNGDAQKAFIRFYGDWRKGVDLHTAAMKKSAEQLRRMADEQLK
ncbi:MAG: WXG100 family type VII secretion target [Anaerolineales bacterium]|nr:WXG100 family type VII secretion target [Anaerolineales bacterium]